ncbi:class I SAM-dependent methyltransferase [bacterium]|nr:class I SAM-dependent methyltransferase [bacterium]
MNFILKQVYKILDSSINSNSIAIDATCGNGNDTIYLSEKVKKVFAFDIQKNAIETTLDRFKVKYSDLKIETKSDKESSFLNVTLINDGHENILNYITETVDFVIFNLGYLPNGDKKISTKFETTEKAIESSFKLLKSGGKIIIVVYWGHEDGQIESRYLKNYLESFPMNSADIMIHSLINKPNNPPYIYEIVKR